MGGDVEVKVGSLGRGGSRRSDPIEEGTSPEAISTLIVIAESFSLLLPLPQPSSTLPGQPAFPVL